MSRAALLRETGGPLSVEEVELADPIEGEVLVRVATAALCHSDLHVINMGGPHLPLIVGHEASGVVERLGPGVSTLTEGDKLIFSFVPSCGRCYFCARDRGLDCERGTGIGTEGRSLDGRFRVRTSDGLDVGQMTRLGVFSERVVVHEDSCVRVPSDTNLRGASLLSCGFTTGAGAAINVARTGRGDTVVVIGAGGVGTGAIQGAVLAGAGEVIAVDINDEKLETARRFGATKTLNARDGDLVEQIRLMSDGRGADAAILCATSLSDEQITSAIECIGKGGVVVLVGAAMALTHIDVPSGALGSQHKTITGTLYGSENPKRDQLFFLDLYRAGRLMLDEMITSVYALDDINTALDDLVAGKNIRGVIEFDGA